MPREMIDSGADQLLVGQPAVSMSRNGIVPPAKNIGKTARQINMLLARGRLLFSKNVYATDTYGVDPALSGVTATPSTTDYATWRFACHTGPLSREVRVVYTMVPAGAARAGGDSYAYWVTETGLTGAGTSTTRAKVYFSARVDSLDALRPYNWYTVEQKLSVDPDTDYRFTLHQSNRSNVKAVAVYETPRLVLNPAVDTNYVDSSKFATNRPITAEAIADLLAGAEKLYQRGGHPLFAWCGDGPVTGNLALDAGNASPVYWPAAGVTRVDNTFANLLDDGVTVSTANTPGWPVNQPYSGTLEVTGYTAKFWYYAGVTAGTGAIQVKRADDDQILTAANITGAAAWRSFDITVSDIAAATETTKLDVEIKGPGGGNTLSVYACGAFMYPA